MVWWSVSVAVIGELGWGTNPLEKGMANESVEFLEGEGPVKRFSMRAFVLVFACLAGSAMCRADELAAVTGLITDPNGRSVPGVTVIMTNLATNVASRTVTNDQGIYRAQSLQPGIYRMTLDKDCFKSIVNN